MARFREYARSVGAVIRVGLGLVVAVTLHLLIWLRLISPKTSRDVWRAMMSLSFWRGRPMHVSLRKGEALKRKRVEEKESMQGGSPTLYAFAEKYAPTVYLNEDLLKDAAWPSSVEDFASQVGEVTKDGVVFVPEIEKMGPPIVGEIDYPARTMPPSSNAQAPVYVTIDCLDKDVTRAEFREALGFDTDSASESDSNAPTYALYELVYWMFFPYNVGKSLRAVGGITLGSHVGDWERVYVRVLLDKWVSPQDVELPHAHEYALGTKSHSFPKQWMLQDAGLDAADNASAYVARGSHGTYAHAGSTRYLEDSTKQTVWTDLFGVTADLVDVHKHGPSQREVDNNRWETAKNVVVVLPEQRSGDVQMPLVMSNGSHINNWWTDIKRWGNAAMGPYVWPGKTRLVLLNRGPTGPAS